MYYLSKFKVFQVKNQFTHLTARIFLKTNTAVNNKQELCINIICKKFMSCLNNLYKTLLLSNLFVFIVVEITG